MEWSDVCGAKPTQHESEYLSRRAYEAGHVSYAMYLRSRAWLDRRKQYAKDHPPACDVCGTSVNLHLHHVNYDTLGSEADSDLLWLCDYHHSLYHLMCRARIWKWRDGIEKLKQLENTYGPRRLSAGP